MLAIKNISGEVIFADALTDNARYSHSLMESEYVALDFNTLTGVELPVGSYIEHDGKVFTLLAPYAPEAVDGGWRYAPQFKAEWMAWDGIAFMFIDPAQARTETTWELTGNIEVFGKAITDNIERMTGKSYAFNYDSTLTKEVTMNFENSTVLSVLNDLAAAYGTEWWVEGDTIHLSMCRYGEEITLETEVNVGAPKVTASKENYGTRWYCYGSTRNIEQEYTNTSIANVSGIADSRLHLPADTYPNGYIDVKPNMKTGEIVERTLILDDIYPHSELTISSVEEDVKQMLDEDGNPVVDRYENGVAIYLTYSIFRFKIAGYELDEDDILPGKPVMVHFKSGLLTGYEFELTYRNKDDNMYPDTYEILYQTTGGGLIIPNSSLKPKEGDQITLFNIRMPDEYKAAAEKELAEKALKQIDYKLLLSAGTFTVNSYPKMFYYYGTMLTVGRNIAYINRSNTLHVRVLSVEYKLTSKWAQTAVIGYIKQSNRLATIEGQVEDMINGIKVIEGHVNSNTSSGNALTRITNSLNANKTKGVDVYYAASTSATIAPTEGWSTTPPVWTNDTYIWTKTITFYADGSSSETLPVCVNGVKGESGANGVGIKSIVEEYFLSSSNTELIGGDWSAVRPEKRDGWYIWTRSKIEYTDGKIERVGAVCATGDTGATGATGAAAVVYSIMPSADKITVSVDDVLSDDSVSCTKYKTTGNSPRVETTEKILRYMRVGVDALEINYTAPVKVTPATEYILFVLYETDGTTILDMERVPVIVDGKGLKEEIDNVKEEIDNVTADVEKMLPTSDKIAQSLGYASYEAMVTAAKASSAIIEGGYINTKLIETEDLFVNHLITKQSEDDDTGNYIQIEPESGMQFYVDQQLVATMNAEEKDDIDNLVPDSDVSIKLTEYEHYSRETHANIEGEMLSSTAASDCYLNDTGSPLTITIPAMTMWVNFRTSQDSAENMYLSEPLDNGTNIDASLSLYNGGAETIISGVQLMDIELEYLPQYSNLGGYTQFLGYTVNQWASAHIPARTITLAAGKELYLTAKHSATITVPTGEILIASCHVVIGTEKPSNFLRHTYLGVGSAKILTQYFGNGLAFIKSTEQYIAMLATKTGTAMAMRSGNRGFRIGVNGESAEMYHVDSANNGKWVVQPYVVEQSEASTAGVTGASSGWRYYRLWSNGWLEQGGRATFSSAADRNTTVTFLKSYQNASKYTFTMTTVTDTKDGPDHIMYTGTSSSSAATKVNSVYVWLSDARGLHWKAEGFADINNFKFN